MLVQFNGQKTHDALISSEFKFVRFDCLTWSCELKQVVKATFFVFTVDGSAIAPYELEFIRDERVMRFLTVKLDKHAIAWAEKRRTKLKANA